MLEMLFKQLWKLCYTEKCVLDGSLSTLFICLSLIFGFQSMSEGKKKVLYMISPNKNFHYYVIAQCLKIKPTSYDSGLK